MKKSLIVLLGSMVILGLVGAPAIAAEKAAKPKVEKCDKDGKVCKKGKDCKKENCKPTKETAPATPPSK